MTLPTSFVTAIQSNHARITRWLEIAGLPWAYGTKDLPSSWFAARTDAEKFLGVVGSASQIPEVESQQLDPLESIASRVSGLSFELIDMDGEPLKWMGVGNTSGHVTLARDLAGPDKTISTYVPASPYVLNTLWRPTTGNGHRYKVTAVSGISGAEPVWPTTSGGVVVTGGVTFTEDGGDDLSFQYVGTATGWPVVPSYLYIGLETVRFTAHDTVNNIVRGMTRGYFRSPRQEFGTGSIVSPRPYAMKGRKTWYYMVATRLTDTESDGDKVLRFFGTLESIKSVAQSRYQLGFLSIQKGIDQDVLRDLRTIRDTENIGITGPTGDEPGVRSVGSVGTAPTDFVSHDVVYFSENEDVVCLIDDEVVQLRRIGSSFRLISRGLYSTLSAVHSPGWTGREVCGVTRYNAAGAQEQQLTKFRSPSSLASPLSSNHPIAILLQFLVSTGTGTNYIAGQRNYDVLPPGWGAGVDASLVDFAACERAADWVGSVECGGVFTQRMPFPDIVRSLLAPMGLYLVATLGEKLQVRPLRPRLPDDGSRDINANVRTSGQATTIDSNYPEAVQQVEFRYARDVIGNKFKRINYLRFAVTDQLLGGTGRELVYELPLLYPGHVKIPGAPPLRTTDVDSILLQRKDFFIHRFAIPPAKFLVTTDYSLLDVEPGDIVLLTDPTVPNPRTGMMGLVAETMQVVSKTVDEAVKTITFELITAHQDGNYRYIAPSLEIESVVSATDFIVKANSFTDPVSGQTDLQHLRPNGTLRNAFTAGMNGLWVLNPDLEQPSIAAIFNIVSINYATRRITTSGYPFTFIAGQFVVFPNGGGMMDSAIYAKAGSNHVHMP